MSSFDYSQHAATDYAAMGLPESGSVFQWRKAATPTPTKRGPKPGNPLTPDQARELKNATNREWMRVKRAQLAIKRDAVNLAHTLTHDAKQVMGRAGSRFVSA